MLYTASQSPSQFIPSSSEKVSEAMRVSRAALRDAPAAGATETLGA